jgi:hypothetical protein
MQLWTPKEVAAVGVSVLPWAALGSACVGLATTGIYSMLALGRAATVVGVTIASGAAMLLSLFVLHNSYGVSGIAASRVAFGLISLTVYIPLRRVLRQEQRASMPGSRGLRQIREGA